MLQYFPFFLGGILIGFSALILMTGIGRILGISGILKALLPPFDTSNSWRIAFLVGIISGALLFGNPQETSQENTILMSLSAILVGTGVSLANGCTSGHAVCGVGRLSYRSIIATTVFVMTAFITTFILQYAK